MAAGTFSLDSAASARGRTYPGVVLGLGLADKIGVRPGHEIVLMGLAIADYALDPTPRVERYTVTGIFQTGFYEYDANLVYVSVASAQSLFGVKGVHGIQFKTDNLFESGVVAKQLQEYVGGYPYWATDWKAQNRSLFEWMKLEKIIIFAVIMLIIFVASLNIFSSLLMVIVEKRREIGILMGLGVTRGAITRIFLYNGIIIGFLGATTGTAVGVLLCYIQYRWKLIPLPGDIYFIDALPVVIQPLDVASVFLAANVLCWLATLYPARQAARILPAESIRNE
jgi:lipoprotein-releasing system permease protein